MSSLFGLINQIQARVDGWINPIAGLGSPSTDKSANWRFEPRGIRIPCENTLAKAYAEDDIVARLAGAIPAAAIGRGFRVTSTSEDSLPDLEGDILFSKQDIIGVVHEAMVWEQLFGGSAIFIGADDGRDVSEPLDLRSVRSISLLLSLDPREIYPFYGGYWSLPDVSNTYRVSIGAWTKQIHRSRLILFRGLPLPRQERRENQHWGASRVRRSWDTIQIFGNAWRAVQVGLTESSQSVFTLSGLADAVSAQGEEAIRRRVGLIQYTRSLINALVLDADSGESWTKVDQSFSGISGILDQAARRLAISTGIPLDVWVGDAPASLGNSNTPLTLWYDQIGSDSNRSLLPAYSRLTELNVALRRARGQQLPDDWKIELAPLQTPTPREEAEVKDKRVQTLLATLRDAALPSEVVSRRIAEILDVSLEPQAPVKPKTYKGQLGITPKEVAARLGRVGNDDKALKLSDWDRDRSKTSISVPRTDLEPNVLDDVFKRYHETVNMSASELERWSKTEASKLAGVSRSPITRNLRLLRKSKSEWTQRDVTDANKTIAFVARMKEVEPGEHVRSDIPYSKQEISLKNWAYNPDKNST